LDRLAHLIEVVAGTSQDLVEELYQAAWDGWDDRELEAAFVRRLASTPAEPGR
jgi:hypothetical protein